VTRSVDELWLSSLQKVTAYVAHDLKGALNGVSVNLEVVRGRSEREGASGADVHKFAMSAADQLGVVIRMTNGLLALGRASRGPADASAVAKQLVGILADPMGSDGGSLEIAVDGGLSMETAAPLNAVRLAIAETILAAGAGKGQVKVRVRGVPEPEVLVTPAPGTGLDDVVVAALSGYGIRVHTDGHGISIKLPSPAELPTEDA
jgi:hypothetical protein